MSFPQFTIIMASYNAEKSIQRSIDNVRNQTFKDFEFVIIDGGSKDATDSIVKKNRDIVHVYISEPDNGIYDAWNKGVKLAKGEWILFIGADDFLLPDALQAYHDFIDENVQTSTYYVSSKIQIISNTGQRRRVFGWPWNWRTFRYMHTVAHPGSLHHRTIFEKFGLYHTSYKIAGDYELLLRPRQDLNALFLNKITLEMTEGGVSSNLRTCIESRRAQIENNVNDSFRINVGFLCQSLKIMGKRFLSMLGLNLYIKREFNR